MSGVTRCAFPKVARDNIPEGHALRAPNGEAARALARMIWRGLLEQHAREAQNAAAAAAADSAPDAD